MNKLQPVLAKFDWLSTFVISVAVYVCIHVCASTHVCVWVSMHMCGGPKLTPNVFLEHFPLYSLRSGLLPKPEFAHSGHTS